MLPAGRAGLVPRPTAARPGLIKFFFLEFRGRNSKTTSRSGGVPSSSVDARLHDVAEARFRLACKCTIYFPSRPDLLHLSGCLVLLLHLKHAWGCWSGSWPTNSPHNCSHPLCREPQLKGKDQLGMGGYAPDRPVSSSPETARPVASLDSRAERQTAQDSAHRE